MLVTLLTPDLGLIRARAEGVRRSGAKLAHALQTLCESDVMLVRGKEGWRVTGAVLAENRFHHLKPDSRMRVARVANLMLRLVNGEASDPQLYGEFVAFVQVLPTLSAEEGEAAESLVVLRLLNTLGLDSGEVPPDGYGKEATDHAHLHRSAMISRINRGISASGL